MVSVPIQCLSRLFRTEALFQPMSSCEEEALGRARAPSGMKELTGLTLDSSLQGHRSQNRAGRGSRRAKRTAVSGFYNKTNPLLGIPSQRAPTQNGPSGPGVLCPPCSVRPRRRFLVPLRWFACLARSRPCSCLCLCSVSWFWGSLLPRPKGGRRVSDQRAPTP